MNHLSSEEMKALLDAQLKRTEAAAVEAVREGRGEAILDYLKWQLFGVRSPLTVVNGVVDVHATMANVGSQWAYLTLVRLVEFATRQDADPARERPTHAVSALSGVGAPDGR